MFLLLLCIDRFEKKQKMKLIFKHLYNVFGYSMFIFVFFLPIAINHMYMCIDLDSIDSLKVKLKRMRHY